MPSITPRTVYVRFGIAAAMSAAVLGVTAVSGQASSIAYVNGNDGNTYVASSTGTDVHEVATGVSSPSLADNGDVYALGGNNVDVYAPGTGAKTPIPITGTNPTQLAVAPFGEKLAWTDGNALIDSTSSASVLNRRTGAVTNFATATGPQWAGFSRLFLSHSPANTLTSSVSVYNGTSTRTVWTPIQGPPAEFYFVLQYAPNAAGTQAAALVWFLTLHSSTFGVVVFPITSSLGPTGNPFATGGSCEVDTGDANPTPSGLTFAWAPNGSAVAYTSATGIKTVSIGAWNSNCSQIGSPQLVIPGGMEPSWGPSNRRNYPTP